MPELLLELFSEEIPARMQARAEKDLLKALTGALQAAGLSHDTGVAMSGPRRLTVVLQGLAARSGDVREERKGPRVGAPDAAVQGFLRGAGLASLDEAEVREDPKKGAHYIAIIETQGRPATEIVAEAVPEIIRGFPWPKSMRWGRGTLRWVRPLQRITCVLDGEVVPFEVDAIASGNETEGHRVHGRGPFTVTGWDDYKAQLERDGHVLLAREDRKARILKAAKAACRKRGLELVEDEGLLEEVAGLAEWPQVLLGDMDPAYLTLPPEVIRLSMRTHQKYFSVRDPVSGALAPHFVVVANLKARDGGKQIAAGNGRVLAARLDDARFFWENDRKTGLEAMVPKLSTIVFKEELGSLGDKVERVAALARELAPKVGADPDLAEKAARLAKADLVSEMVCEFPELQGVMGRYYALEAGEDPAVANAIADHYKPQGPSDAVPTAPVSIAVALADKLDTLVGFWAIDEKPTGSKDPFALRRAALGVVRIVLENELKLSLREAFGLEQEIVPLYENLYGYREADLSAIGNHIAGLHKIANPELYGDSFESSDPDSEWNRILRELHEEFFPDGENTEEPDDAILIDEWELEDSRDFDASEMLLTSTPLDDRRVYRMSDIQHLLVAPPEVVDAASVADDLLAFFADRLKVHLKDQGIRHDLIEAVFALGAPEHDRAPAGQAAPAEVSAKPIAVSDMQDDLVLVVRRVEALGDFLASNDGASLLAGYKRAANILKAELKRDGVDAYHGAIDKRLIEAAAERDLHGAIETARAAAYAALSREDFQGAMAALAPLRAPVDRFFDEVTVNDERGEVRRNRLLILSAIRDALHGVADFSKIEG